MSLSTLHSIQWAQAAKQWLAAGAILGAGLVMGALIALLDLKLSVILVLLPVLSLYVGAIVVHPRVGIYSALIASFVVLGIARYIPFSWGLTIDGLLVLALIGYLFQPKRPKIWLENGDVILLSLVWMGYLVLELGNPEMPGLQAWAFAMRGIGFYQLICFVLAFSYLRQRRDLDLVMNSILVMSVLGAMWGLKQQFIGLDYAENYWLWVEDHQDEHILHGVLRVFSFYSDAGQFGASQATVAVICGILILGPFSIKKRLIYLVVAGISLVGFLYSGTRGAMAVFVGGGLVYMVLSKNFKILALGILVMGIAFYMLKYTYIMHGFQPVARMRTALSADNPSLQARLRNQVTFGNYLRSRPMGGGIGSAGYWGERFRPGSLLANTPTDSYYVKIWAETGILGVGFHLLVLGYFLGKGSYIVWNIRNAQLKQQMLALMAAYGGVLLASYGNQVFSQFPTGIMMAFALPMIFMAPLYDAELSGGG